MACLTSAICVKLLWSRGIPMSLLSELVAATAQALRFEERSAALCARYLREAGLISQKGRGPSAAHMGPRDATNLLLGIMASDVIMEAPACVRLAREATFDGGEINFRGAVVNDPPPCPFMNDETGAVALGEALDALFDEVVRCGDPIHDSGLPITNFALQVTRPGLYAMIEVDSGDQVYIARYRREHPQFESLEGEALLKEARKIGPQERSAMRTTTEIGLDPIWAMANVLRGYESKEGERVRPPYEDDDDG